MKIALFSEVFLPKIDGVVTRLIRTLDSLAELGHEVLVFTPGNPPQSYAGHRVVPVRSVSLKKIYPEIKIGFPGRQVIKELKDFRPDVVHAVNPVWLAGFGALAAHRLDIALLASFHTDLPSYTEKFGLGALRKPMESWIRKLHNLADVNLCTSTQMVEKASRLGIGRLDLWPKAVDADNYQPSKYSPQMRNRLSDGHPQDPLIVYVGRLSHEKDLLDLVEPIKRLGDKARLALVGSGPNRVELQRRFAGTNTVFTGYLSGEELASAYASADIFVFPSTTETLGLVALEAMASGVPVVGANAGGIPFVVEDSVTGFLVEPHNPDQLVNRLELLIDNPQLRAEMRANAINEANKHSWLAATEKLISCYREAIETNTSRRYQSR